MPNFDKRDPRIDAISAVCHDANRAYCQEVGDFTQKPWNDASEADRESTINSVKFHLENPSAGPSASHDAWKRYKKSKGWRYGPFKDARKKEHPCMVEYEALPMEQKLKDYIFCNIVKAFIDAESDVDGYNKKTKLLVVESQQAAITLIKEGYFADCDIIPLGSAVTGEKYEKIVIMMSRESDVDDELLQIYINQLKTCLDLDCGKLIVL